MLSTLWIFAVMNYIYADVFTAMDPSAEGGSVRMSHGMMLGAAALMETAMVMVPLSRFLRYRANRWANIVAGVMHTMAVILSLFVGGAMPASYYLLVASVEVISTSFIATMHGSGTTLKLADLCWVRVWTRWRAKQELRRGETFDNVLGTTA